MLEALFFEGDEFAPYLVRLISLMALSVTIAVLGLLADSSAVVIGAMLVAPLMTPILASAAATVMAWPRRQGRGLALVLLLSAGSVGLAYALAIFTSARDPLLSGEILARTEPTLLDLGVALAAGAAGAYVTVRTKGGAALPGVAVAVALVPPLATAGILLERRELEAAEGALLLFATNLAGIYLAAGVVFLATGFIPRSRTSARAREIRIGLAVSALLVVAVAYPLGLQGRAIVNQLNDERAVRESVERFITTRQVGGAASRTVLLDTTIDVDADPAVVTLALAGPPDRAPTRADIDQGARTIADALGRRVIVRYQYTPVLAAAAAPSALRRAASGAD